MQKTVLLEVPETIYQQFQVMAQLTHQRLEEVVMQTIQGNLPPAFSELPADLQQELAIWVNLPAEILWRLAQETLPNTHTRLQKKLLQKNQAGLLTEQEKSELTRLRTLTDHFVLRRSTLLALLKWRGYTLPFTTPPVTAYAVAS